MGVRHSAQELRASVVICTYNRCRALLQTLDSLERQSTAGPFEALEARWSSVALRWLWQPNAGAAAARNAAARLTVARVLIFLDDDQVAEPELVATHLAAQDRYPGALVQGSYPLAEQATVR